MDDPQLSNNEFPMGGALVGVGSLVQHQSVVPGQLQVAPKGIMFWDGIFMVVLFLQIEITISFHRNQSSLEHMIYTVLLRRFPFGQNFCFQHVSQLATPQRRGVLSILFRFQIELGFLTIACCVSWPWVTEHPCWYHGKNPKVHLNIS
jgi:hypothetical protein